MGETTAAPETIRRREDGEKNELVVRGEAVESEGSEDEGSGFKNSVKTVLIQLLNCKTLNKNWTLLEQTSFFTTVRTAIGSRFSL